MRDFLVYLAGPILGRTFAESTEWRRTVEFWFSKTPIRTISPMREKDNTFKDEIEIQANYSDTAIQRNLSQLFSTPRAILTRDFFDCTRADAVLVNFLDATEISVGTVMEIAWAHAKRIPIIVVMEPNNIHQHPMIQEAAKWIVPSLFLGVEILKSVLLPEGIEKESRKAGFI